MDTLRLLIVTVIASAVCAGPVTLVQNDLDYGALAIVKESQLPDSYFAIVRAVSENEIEPHDDSDNPLIMSVDDNGDRIEKRSVEEADDLETAAGTNVLRPLFVYRQQLAYRDRVKKGAGRRPGIRPRF